MREIRRRAAAALRKHRLGVLRAAWARAPAIARRAVADAAERWFDARRGIHTAGVIPAGTDGASTNYQAVHPKALAAFLEHVPDDRRDLTCVVVFLYNPFDRAVMADVLAEVTRSLRADPRPAWVIYENPVDRDLLDGNPIFELVAERTERAGASPARPLFAIYRTPEPADPS
jgi:hypothetical protein